MEHLVILFFGIIFSVPAGFRFNYIKTNFPLSSNPQKAKDYILVSGNELKQSTDAAHNMLRDLKWPMV